MAEQDVYDDDGDRLGSAVPIEGGGWALVSDDGEVLSAVDADDQPLDVSEFEVSDVEDYDASGRSSVGEDPRLAELQAEVRALREQAAAPREPVQYAPPAILSGEPHLNEQQVFERWAEGRDRLELALGRRLTQAEFAKLAVAAGDAGHSDVVRAAVDAADAGDVLLDLDPDSPIAAHEARTQHMTELLAERSDQAPDPFTGQAPRRSEAPDLDTHQGRVDAALDALAGHDVPELRGGDFEQED